MFKEGKYNNLLIISNQRKCVPKYMYYILSNLLHRNANFVDDSLRKRRDKRAISARQLIGQHKLKRQFTNIELPRFYWNGDGMAASPAQGESFCYLLLFRNKASYVFGDTASSKVAFSSSLSLSFQSSHHLYTGGVQNAARIPSTQL